MASCTESKIEINGCEINLRRGGSGPILLFLHGAGGLPGWMPFLETLSDSFDVIAPDHPTFGLSGDAEWLRDMGDMGYYYLDFIKELELDNIHLVGQSLGGWIGLEVAVRSTQNLSSLTLVASAGIRIKGMPAADIFMMNPEERTRALLVDENIIDAMLSIKKTEAEEDLETRNIVSTARMGWQPRMFNPGLRRWMHRIDIPTHVIWGDQDQIISPAYAEEFKSLISDASVTMLDNCGHLPQVECAGPFTDAVTGFIASNAA